jgi:hypothetical protein
MSNFYGVVHLQGFFVLKSLRFQSMETVGVEHMSRSSNTPDFTRVVCLFTIRGVLIPTLGITRLYSRAHFNYFIH